MQNALNSIQSQVTQLRDNSLNGTTIVIPYTTGGIPQNITVCMTKNTHYFTVNLQRGFLLMLNAFNKFIKNKKGDGDLVTLNIKSIVLWIVFFLIVGFAIYAIFNWLKG